MELELRGKGALITGGTRGIGRACALKLAAEGADVAVCGRQVEGVTQTVQALEHLGRRGFGLAVDVLSTDGVERFVEQAGAALGRLDCVVANVGGTFGPSTLGASADEWLQTFSANIFHAVRLIKAAVPWLERSGGGSVVIIASISGTRPGPRAQYGAAKAAEIQLARSLGRELGPQRIRVNSVSPGSIRFEGGSWAKRAEQHPALISEFVAREFPLGRMGTLEEISDVVTFLSSARASWINGADIVVDGGQGVPSVTLPELR